MAIIKVVKAGKTKASLKSALNYIANEEKITTITGKKLITPLNCWGSLKNIYDTMIATKELYRKAVDNKNSEMYKHFQQSFKPNEITPEKAHEIGKKWAMQNFAQNGFEVCICTHLDTEHIHNHFIINSVNAITGKTIEIHANKTLEKLKYSSDELCRKYNLSVIERDIFAQNKNHEYNMRKKYSFLREQFRDLTWQKTVYDKIIDILNKSRNKDFKYFEQELLKVGIKLEHERLKKDFIFNYIDENRKVSDKTLAKTFHDDKILRSNIEMIWGKTLQYDLDKKYAQESHDGIEQATVAHNDAHATYIVELAMSIAYNRKDTFLLMVKNNGIVNNLDDGMMLEVACQVGNHGAEPFHVGDVPTFEKGLLEGQYAYEKLTVDATLEGSYQKALQALVVNRTVVDTDLARKILDDYISVNKDYFPKLK